jgi:hypothetical protein
MITTLAEAEAHQRKHGFLKDETSQIGKDLAMGRGPTEPKQPGPKMTKTEREYSFILEAMKRRGEIDDYEFEGMTLKWGGLRYTPDFIVVKTIPIECESCGKTHARLQTYIRFIEVKGGHIWEDSLVKFKAARARWYKFQFEMHQKKAGEWKRIH